MQSMRLTTPLKLLVLVLLISACTRQDETGLSPDANMQRKLCGVWMADCNYSSGTVVSNTITVAPDGSYVARLSIPGRKYGPRDIEQRGVWRVEPGFIIDTVTNDSQTNAIVPSTNRFRVLRVNDSELVVEPEKIPGVGYPTNQTIFRKQTK